MEESEDIKKIDAIIEKHKIETRDNDEIEYAEFIDYDNNANEVDSFEFDDYEIPSFARADITKFNTYAPSQFLTEDEKGLINSCTNQTLKDLLILNRTKNIHLMQLYRKIKDLLVECQASITVNEEKFKALKQSRKVCSRIWRLGIPYFKTLDDFPCPRNSDIIKKHNNGEMFFYDMTPSFKWSQKDINRLREGISFQYKKNREFELDKLLTESQKNNDLKATEDLAKNLAILRKGDTSSCYPPLNCNKYLDWTRLSQRFFNERYSAKDCQVFWNTYLHPEINKSLWTAEESEKLKALVLAHNYQNWDHIAEELGGNRTGFITCVHYYCKINNSRHGSRFTPEEDKRLCDLVEKYREGEYIPWAKIAHHFSARTRAQLFYRHRYFLSCRQGTLKGKFSEAEDILILILVDRFGKKFTKCGEYFPHRSVVQIKARYTSNLKGAIKKGSFTMDEDQKILEYVKENGTGNWEPLVKTLSRCGAQIRQRYNTLISFQRTNPNLGLDKAPRRRFSGISFNTEYAYLRLMADKFKSYDKIPTLEDIQRLLESNPKPKAKPLMPLTRVKETRTENRKLKTYQRLKVDLTSEERNGDFGNKAIDIESTESENNSKLKATKGNSKRVLSLFEDSDNDETSLPSLALDDLITEFFSNSIKLHFEQNIQKEVINQATNILGSVLSTLQAELRIPKDFKLDSRLDAIDLEILDVLKEDKPITINDEYVVKRAGLLLERTIPPNLNTILSMKALLIKNHMYKVKCAKRAHIFSDFRKDAMEKQVLWCINNHLSNQPEDIRSRIVTERNMFFRRFISLFKFPAIMSLVEPSANLQTSINQREVGSSYAIRTYQKRPKIQQTNSNYTAPFESIFIKECGELNYANETELDHVGNKAQVSHFCIITNNPSEMTITKTPLRNMSMADQLKRKIDQTISELINSPPTKKFFHQSTDIITGGYYHGKLFEPEEETNNMSRNSIAAVIDKDILGIEKKKGYVKGRVTEKAQIRTYIPRTKVRATSSISNDLNSENFALVKAENIVNSRLGEAQSSFNLGKGELVVKNDFASNQLTTIDQDLQDVKLLNDILKKEKNVIDESLDF